MVSAWSQAAVVLVVLAAIHVPLGNYLARAFSVSRHLRVESALYRFMRVDPDADQRWPVYAGCLLVFSALSTLLLYAMLRLQPHLPLALGEPAMPPAQAWNTAVSFGTNTSWQSYAADREPDIILLDLGLPDLDGVDVLHALRGWTSIPVIVLSGRAGSVDTVGALDAGADDYLTKPFLVGELVARLRAVARRPPTPAEPLTVALGDYLIDLDARRVTRHPVTTHPSGAADVRLTPTEWHLLDILLRNPGKLVTHRQLLPGPGGPAPTERSHYLRQYIGRLRRRFELDPAHPRHLITEPGVGYRFQP